MPETRRVSCPACSAVYEWEGTLGRQTCCPACSAWLHCCMACRFYDTSRFNDCSEPAADRVVDKEVAEDKEEKESEEENESEEEAEEDNAEVVVDK